MPIFRSSKYLYYGDKTHFKLMGTDLKELRKFYDTWNGSFSFADPRVKEMVNDPDISRRQLDALQTHALKLKWSDPGRKVGLTTTRSPIQVLVEVKDRILVENQRIHEIHDKHFPVLNMILRQQFARTCPGGLTLEMSKFYEREIAGKVRDLAKTPDAVIKNPSDSGHQFLNKMLEKIDLGRRSNLNLYSNAGFEEGTEPETYESPVWDPEDQSDSPPAPEGEFVDTPDGKIPVWDRKPI